MRTLSAHQTLPGATVAQTEALWLDLKRWPSFVDGFARVHRVQGAWPRAGARVVWDSREGGRGRVVEKVLEYEPGRAQSVDVEDPQLTGTQAVHFTALEDGGGAAVTLELSYELKRSGVGAALVDLFLTRHQLRESLRRTLARFAVELKADRERAS